MSTTDTERKERIDAIPRHASVLGVDSNNRVHLFDHSPTEVWVVDRHGTRCLHYVATPKPISEWVGFVAERCGWDRRHRVELAAGERLFDAEPTPPTRAEVLGQMYHVVCHDCPAERLTAHSWRAHDTVQQHEDLTGHNIEFAEVSRQMLPPRLGRRCPTCGVELLAREGPRCDGCRRDRPD